MKQQLKIIISFDIKSTIDWSINDDFSYTFMKLSFLYKR